MVSVSKGGYVRMLNAAYELTFGYVAWEASVRGLSFMRLPGVINDKRGAPIGIACGF